MRAGIATILLALTAVFTRWRAGSALDFPIFLGACYLFFWCPGRLLLGARRRRDLDALEVYTLTMILGMVTSAPLFGLLTFLGVGWAFPAWPAVALIARLRKENRTVERPTEQRDIALSAPRLALAAMVLAAVALLAVLPAYYRNYARRPDGTMRSVAMVDPLFHIAVVSELTHQVPPQIPWLAGEKLSYHYGRDLVAAVLVRWARLDVADVVLRFLPTLEFVLAILAAFCFVRRWTGSEGSAALAAFLVFFAEDLAFVFGLVRHAKAPRVWSAEFFGVPTTYSLFASNPMVLALAVFFSALLALWLAFRRPGHSWTGNAAGLLGALPFFKIFLGIQTALALALAALAGVVLWRRTELARVAVAALPLALLAAVVATGEIGGQREAAVLHFGEPLGRAIVSCGLAATFWGARALALLSGERFGLTYFVALLFFALPFYLVGSLGIRLVAVPFMMRRLDGSVLWPPMRLFLVLFALVGLTLGLVVLIVPRGYSLGTQYNNSVWFYVQGKYVLAVLAAEALFARGRKLSVPGRFAALLVVGLLSLPSTAQFLSVMGSMTADTIPSEDLIIAAEIERRSVPGDVAMCGLGKEGQGSDRLERALLARTRCRLPFVPIFTASFASPEEVLRRTESLTAFWQEWERGRLLRRVLDEFGVRWLIAERGLGLAPAVTVESGPSATPVGLRMIRDGSRYRLFEVVQR